MRRRAREDKEEFGELFAQDPKLRHNAGRFYASVVHNRRRPGAKQSERVKKAITFLQQYRGPIGTKTDRERRNLEMCKQCIDGFAKLPLSDQRYQRDNLIAAVKGVHIRERAKGKKRRTATKADSVTAPRTNQQDASVALQPQQSRA
jgi:hypothetical protein